MIGLAKTVMVVLDHKNKRIFQIEQNVDDKFDLVFYDWHFRYSNPSSYCDPILVNANYDDCFDTLVNILRNSENLPKREE